MGIIPAYAGLTILPLSSLSHSWDHPRVCGAHFCPDYARLFDMGSSPRMRGSLLQPERQGELPGIIPAYAGLTDVAYKFNDDNWDHPRVCGAHSHRSLRRAMSWGSSPRMRGSLATNYIHRHSTGIIPAYAGLTVKQYTSKENHWDHPRVCGAHVLMMLFLCAVMGSSPRMRGSPSQESVRLSMLGIIPAYAGLTCE